MITPRELPELRNTLYTHHLIPRAFHQLWELSVREFQAAGGDAGTAESYMGGAATALATGKLHYIDSRFCALVSAAAPSLPRSPLAEHDLPTPRGLMYFSEPLLDGRSNQPARWIALWSLYDDVDRSQKNVGFVVWWMVDRETKWHRAGFEQHAQEEGVNRATRDAAVRALPPFYPSLCGAVKFGEADDTELVDPVPGSPNWLLKYLLTTWHVQRQRLTTSRIVRPDRASLRRLKRAGDPSDPAVRVISLRTPEPNGSQEQGAREYRHQWMVRGHWRKQWYPSIEDHRPIWIDPYLKGPDDAPMLGGEKVYDWNR